MPYYMDLIKEEIDGLYGSEVLKDMKEIIDLYDWYEGKGQEWQVSPGLDYKPTQKKSNYIKKLIKEEARFLFGKTPEVRITSKDDKSEAIRTHVNKVLDDNMFSDRIVKAARDCFVGKRVALKITGGVDEPIQFSFRNSLEFVYETEYNCDLLNKIIFFYGLNDKQNKQEQRIWKQKYHMENGICILDEGVYNGYGEVVEIVKKDYNTGLHFIPAKVILNDGLSGDLKGESDVDELKELQDIYNRLTSDDIDALKFNMFPQTVAVNASEESLESIHIAPSALIDLQTDTVSEYENSKADMYKLESSFNYDSRIENTLNRIKNEMFELLNIPNLSVEQLKGIMTSGKSMKAMYWQLVTRCEEKYTAWQPVLEWLVSSIIKMTVAYKLEKLDVPDDLHITVENIFPLMEDEFEEKSLDMQAVNSGVMSRKTYIKKWNRGINDDLADEELKQIQLEKQILEDSYIEGMGINNDTGEYSTGG